MENQITTTAKRPLTIVFPTANKSGITPAQGTRVLDHEGNEIEGVSGIHLSACVNGFWKAQFTVSAAFSGVLHVENSLGLPAIGEYWQDQGGVYAGIMRDGTRQWHLILATDPKSILEDVEWGNYGKEIKGDFSRRDGAHNTQLIIAADPDNKIASHVSALLIDGHKDFYIPAQCENNLIFNNIPEHISKVWHWSSTQSSARSAWGQDFEDGDQRLGSKYGKLAARAVRRVLVI